VVAAGGGRDEGQREVEGATSRAVVAALEEVSQVLHGTKWEGRCTLLSLGLKAALHLGGHSAAHFAAQDYVYAAEAESWLEEVRGIAAHRAQGEKAARQVAQRGGVKAPLAAAAAPPGLKGEVVGVRLIRTLPVGGMGVCGRVQALSALLEDIKVRHLYAQ
jgi:hypothetical protein